MTAATLAPTRPEGSWHGLFTPDPDVCPVHRCWVDECEPGSHDLADDGGEA